MLSARHIQTFAAIAFIAESFCITYAYYLPQSATVTSVIYALAGVVIALCIWLAPSAKVLPSSGIKPVYRITAIIVITLLIMIQGRRLLINEPLDYHNADMLPIIQTMCERFLAGKWAHVYDPIPAIWDGIQPVYLPAMWLPYTLPVSLGIDVRWVTLIALSAVFGIFFRRVGSFRQWPLIVGALILLLWLLTARISGLIIFSEEGLVILYYVLLVLAINTRNAWLIGVASACCLFSRYAFIGWLPAMVLFYSYQKQWKNVFRFVTPSIVAWVALLLIPFGWNVFELLLLLPRNYIAFAQRVWHDNPDMFTQGPGLAKFFGPLHVKRQHYALIAGSLLIPVSFTAILLYSKKMIAHRPHIPLAILKLSLVIFYCLIDVPYQYLFFTSSFVGLISLGSFRPYGTDNLQGQESGRG